MQLANTLHSLAILVLRQARVADTETGLNPQRLSVLSVLAFGGSKTIGELATIEQVSRPAVSNLVSALEAEGLAFRERLSSDARSVMVHPSTKGLKLLEQARVGRLQIVAKRLASLSAKELDCVDEALKLLG